MSLYLAAFNEERTLTTVSVDDWVPGLLEEAALELEAQKPLLALRMFRTAYELRHHVEAVGKFAQTDATGRLLLSAHPGRKIATDWQDEYSKLRVEE